MTLTTNRARMGRVIILIAMLLALLVSGDANADGGVCGSGSTTGCQQPTITQTG